MYIESYTVNAFTISVTIFKLKIVYLFKFSEELKSSRLKLMIFICVSCKTTIVHVPIYITGSRQLITIHSNYRFFF